VIWLVLTGPGFPPSTVPFYLVFAGLAVDLVRRFQLNHLTEALAGAAAITVLGYGALYLQSVAVAAPPTAWWSAPITFVAFAALWWGGRELVSRRAVARAG